MLIEAWIHDQTLTDCTISTAIWQLTSVVYSAAPPGGARSSRGLWRVRAWRKVRNWCWCGEHGRRGPTHGAQRAVRGCVRAVLRHARSERKLYKCHKAFSPGRTYAISMCACRVYADAGIHNILDYQNTQSTCALMLMAMCPPPRVDRCRYDNAGGYGGPAPTGAHGPAAGALDNTCVH